MCIIAAKPAGVAMPDRDTIRTMWNGNGDGAGLMYIKDNRVIIEKGFMKYKAFAKKLDELERKMDLTSTPVVMHFRITTHGGTKPENCHPFPITDCIGALGKRKTNTDIGVAHNGIINIVPRKGISDTMEYIASQLAPLKRALPRFYENKNAMLLVKNAIDSKMAFLTKEGKIYTVGDFIEDEGILYSNYSYCKYTNPYRNLGNYSCYGYGGWDMYDDDYWNSSALDEIEPLMWLEEGDYIRTDRGEMYEGYDYLMDADGKVYQYDYKMDEAVMLKDCTAHSVDGLPKRFDYELAAMTPVSTCSVTHAIMAKWTGEDAK